MQERVLKTAEHFPVVVGNCRRRSKERGKMRWSRIGYDGIGEKVEFGMSVVGGGGGGVVVVKILVKYRLSLTLSRSSRTK